MKEQKEDVVLYSDGGGERSASAAGACIVENPSSGRRRQFVVYLGGATNNEAEICGALLGYSFLALLGKSKGPMRSVRWICDSEYVLKSATGYITTWQRNGWKTAGKEPVKNQGLWRCYLTLSAGMEIVPEHVRGHSGHLENEACDMASTWAQINGETILSEEGDGARAHLGGEDEWVVFDGREFLARLRESGAQVEDHFCLVTQMEHAELGKSKAGAARAKTKPPANGKVAVLMDNLRALYKQAAALAKEDPKAKEIAETLKSLVKKA